MKNLLTHTLIVSTVVLGSLVGTASRSYALTFVFNTVCSNSNISGAIDCTGAFSNGNNTGTQSKINASLSQITTDFADTLATLGASAGTWSQIGTTNQGQSSGPFGLTPGSATGTLTFDTAQTGIFAVALKSSTKFSFYLFNGGTTGISSLTYNTIGTSKNNQGLAQGLSHATLYRYSGTVTPRPVQVHEPISSLVGFVGLAAVGLLKKRLEN